MDTGVAVLRDHLGRLLGGESKDEDVLIRTSSGKRRHCLYERTQRKMSVKQKIFPSSSVGQPLHKVAYSPPSGTGQNGFLSSTETQGPSGGPGTTPLCDGDRVCLRGRVRPKI